MMEMGFEIQLKEIFDDYGMDFSQMQVVFASATFPPKVINIAYRYIKQAITIRLPKEENATNKNIEQVIQNVEDDDKLLRVFELLSS